MPSEIALAINTGVKALLFAKLEIAVKTEIGEPLWTTKPLRALIQFIIKDVTQAIHNRIKAKIYGPCAFFLKSFPGGKLSIFRKYIGG